MEIHQKIYIKYAFVKLKYNNCYYYNKCCNYNYFKTFIKRKHTNINTKQTQ